MVYAIFQTPGLLRISQNSQMCNTHKVSVASDLEYYSGIAGMIQTYRPSQRWFQLIYYRRKKHTKDMTCTVESNIERDRPHHQSYHHDLSNPSLLPHLDMYGLMCSLQSVVAFLLQDARSSVIKIRKGKYNQF